MLKITIVAMVQNFGIIFDKFNVVGVYTIGNCAQKWIIE
jgi:hypothetical protein